MMIRSLDRVMRYGCREGKLYFFGRVNLQGVIVGVHGGVERTLPFVLGRKFR